MHYFDLFLLLSFSFPVKYFAMPPYSLDAASRKLRKQREAESALNQLEGTGCELL